jgi:Ethanolamine utilization protein EutJ (predicted chaperonin)
MGEDYNNSSLNNLFGNFLNIEEEDQETYDFTNVNKMVSIDTSNHRIGINTLDPTCSLDISGSDGKIIVNSISCENLDITGTLDLISSNTILNIVDIDNSGTIGVGGLYYDASGFIKIKLNENNKIN